MLRTISILGVLMLVVVLPAVGCRKTKPAAVVSSPMGFPLDPSAAAYTPPGGYPAPGRVPAVANEWVCSMHRTFKMPQPGKCSICGMDLVHVSELPGPQESSSRSGHSQHSSGSGRSSSSGSGGSCH